MMVKRKRLSAYLSMLAITYSAVGYADNGLNLPDIGTTASSTLTIAQEENYGDAYMRILRSHQPVINDPTLNQYINQLGHKLVANADDVKTPFRFILIQNREINAFAFFGGYVALHSGLFLHAGTESELASVLAHEIAHITQRHLARSMEAQAQRTPATIAALAGSLLLAIAAPQAGVAALTATTAGSIQSQINYTRSNEEEADRFGLKTLAKAGYNPQAMPRFFSRLADEYRYTSTPPEMLLTHPLPQSRITDSRNRAQQYPSVSPQPSLNYTLARVRVVVRYAGLRSAAALDWLERHAAKAPTSTQAAYQYGKALVYLDDNKLDQAQAILSKLYQEQSNNYFYLDALSDLWIAKRQPSKAIDMLDKALALTPKNPILTINYANALIENQQADKAISVLQRYTHAQPSDTNGWYLLSKSYSLSGDRAQELAAQGELLALKARWDQAINNYTQASQLAKIGSLEQARFDARVDQLSQQRQLFLQLEN